jgi:hypothetical protein
VTAVFSISHFQFHKNTYEGCWQFGMFRISDLKEISAEAVVRNTLLLYIVECMEKVGAEIAAAGDGKFGCTRSVPQDGR